RWRVFGVGGVGASASGGWVRANASRTRTPSSAGVGAGAASGAGVDKVDGALRGRGLTGLHRDSMTFGAHEVGFLPEHIVIDGFQRRLVIHHGVIGLRGAGRAGHVILFFRALIVGHFRTHPPSASDFPRTAPRALEAGKFRVAIGALHLFPVTRVYIGDPTRNERQRNPCHCWSRFAAIARTLAVSRESNFTARSRMSVAHPPVVRKNTVVFFLAQITQTAFIVPAAPSISVDRAGRPGATAAQRPALPRISPSTCRGSFVHQVI